MLSLTPDGELRFSDGTFHDRGSLGQEVTFGNDRLFFAFDMYSIGPPRLFGYDLDGELRFEAPNPANGTQPATGPNGNVVLPTFPIGVGLSVGAFNGNGTPLWHFYEFPGNVQSPVDIGPDNTSYSSRNLSTLLALDAAGGVRWRHVDPGILFEPAVPRTGSVVFVPGRVNYGEPGFFLGVSPSGQPRWRVDLPDEPGFDPYGQLVASSRSVFSANSDTAYVVTDVLGDGDHPFAYLYAVDVTTGGAPPPPPPPTAATAATTAERALRPHRSGGRHRGVRASRSGVDRQFHQRERLPHRALHRPELHELLGDRPDRRQCHHLPQHRRVAEHPLPVPRPGVESSRGFWVLQRHRREDAALTV